MTRCSAHSLAPTATRSGFTLLEVVVALGILSMGMMVLVDTQASSVLSTVSADQAMVANELVQEKLTEVMLLVEVEGFTDQDKSETGNFENFGDEDWRGDSLDLDVEGLEDFHYEWTVRKIELTIPTDLAAVMGDLEDVGYIPDDQQTENTDSNDSNGAPDLSSFGITPEVISDYLGDYIRELRVVVWWGSEEPQVDEPGQLPENSVELLTHVINPTGQISAPLGGAL
ncbi:MAG: type II secretion system protein [Oligoflexia bacterium]|nr:type II secretion system protein [Oligoflexia bacterium]